MIQLGINTVQFPDNENQVIADWYLQLYCMNFEQVRSNLKSSTL